MISVNKVYKNIVNQFESDILKQVKKFDSGKISDDDLIKYNVYDGYLYKNLGFTFNDGKFTFRFKAKIGTKIDRSTLFTEVKGNKIFIGIGNLDFHFIESDKGVAEYIRDVDFYSISNSAQFDPFDSMEVNAKREKEYLEKARKSLSDTNFSVKFNDSKKFFPGCSGNMIPVVAIDFENNRYGYYYRRNALSTREMLYRDLGNIEGNNIVGNTPDAIFILSVSKFGENLLR